jgi:cytochrome c peroxidase
MRHDVLAGSSFISASRARPYQTTIRVIVVWALLGVCPTPSSQAASPNTYPAASWDHEPIVPIPLTVDLDQAQVALGEKLFHDPRLSRHNAMACATCHQLAQGGDDGRPRAITADGTPHRRNTPTVFNVALNFRYHWDGAVRTLEAETEAALHSPAMMHTTWPELLAKLRADADYVAGFNALYPDGLTPAHVLHALVTYERSLVTPNARFDQYLRGRHEALSAAEKRGYQLFTSYGCVACHQGVNVGGNMFQKIGIFGGPRGDLTEDDLGRFTVTGAARDRGVFRVPSLRNVAVTAPYFHDGWAQTLEKAVEVMARRQLGKTLTAEEISLIVQFLHTLTGEYQGRSLALAAEEAP